MIQNKEEIVAQLASLIEKGNKLAKSASDWGYISSPMFNAWRAEILTILRCAKLNVPEYIGQITAEDNRFPSNAIAVTSTIETIKEQLNAGLFDAQEKSIGLDTELENIFNKFHKVARQLRTRHDSRSTLKIEDEYDVQDLLHALLLLHFEDVRPEEWTPSYAGGSVRMDFLLKDEGIVVEVKKTRKSMTAKSLGEELLIDREKYKIHPDCKKMYCFVYDPEGLLGNPNGIKKDLEKGAEDFIKVFIRPE